MGVVVVLLLIAGGVFLLLRVARRRGDAEGPAGASPPGPRLEVTVSHPGGSSTTVLDLDGPAAAGPVDPGYELMDELSEISGEFFADVQASANGVFLVGARDGPGVTSDRDDGLLVLANRQTREVMFLVRLPRPHGPSVSDEGWVVVEDWGSSGELEGSLVCFEPSGERAWSLDLRANIYASGLSPSGDRAFVVTARSDYEPHSNRLFFLDARTAEVLWERDNFKPHKAVFALEGDEMTASVVMRDGSTQSFVFGADGSVGPEFESARVDLEVQRFSPDAALVPRVREALAVSPPDLDEAERLLGLVDLEGLWEAQRAKVLRLRGEVHEARGDVVAAVSAYREALELDPKVGVKRRLAALERELA